MEQIAAAITAAFLTLFDLDKTFYIPRKSSGKIFLNLWWWGFVLANALLAGALTTLTSNITALQGLHPVLRGAAIGLGYLAIVRAKFTTFSVNGRDIPFGFETIYEAAKEYFYRKINEIARAERLKEALELVTKSTLKDLTQQARLTVDTDAVASDEEKVQTKKWILAVLKDKVTTEEDKKGVLAIYILSGRRPVEPS